MTRLTCAAVLLLAACSNEPPGSATTGAAETPPSASPPSASPPAAPTLSCQGLERSLLLALPTRAGLRERFGAPARTEMVAVPNRHVPDATDSLFTLHYPGLVAHVHWPAGGADIPDLVETTDGRYVADPRLGPGAAEREVIAALGEPTRREAAALVYDCGEAVEQPVRFELAEGRVRRIVIDYYVD